MSQPTGPELERIRTHRDQLRHRHLRPMADRPTSNGAPIELYREDLGTFDGNRILPG
jgi:hypothetical protein